MIEPSTEAPHNRLPPHEDSDDRRASGGRAADGAHSDAPHGTAADLFAPLMAHLQELKEYFSYYFAARADLVKAKIRKVVFYAAIGIVGALAGATLLVVAVVMLLSGVAGGLAELMGNRPWAGNLATGTVLAAVIFGSLRMVMPQWLVTSRRQTKDKYDRRRQTQRSRFGHDVDEIRKNQRG